MKILYVITSTSPGGAENALAGLASTLIKNHNIKIVSLKPLGAFAGVLQKNGIEVVSLDMGYLPRPRHLAELKKIIADFKPDAVHAMLFRAIQMCRVLKGNFKLFTTPHANYRNKNFFLRLVDAALKSRDDLAIAESYAAADFLLVNQRYDKKKVIVIPNRAPSNFRPDKTARDKMRAAENADGKIIFITVSRLEKEKGHRSLLDAFAKIYGKNKNALLWLVGDGTERGNLEAAAAASGIKNAVKFWGFQMDVRPFLNAADVFVLPSPSESRPLALLEAAACGLPLIAADTGDNADIVRPGQNGFICNAQDAVILAALMAELAENQILRRNFSAASQKISAESNKDYAQEHLEIYKN